MTTEAGPLPVTAPVVRTLSDLAAEQLRRAIVGQELKAGQRIVEEDIARALQTSRGPVRDALKILENEGLVTRFPHRGTFVTRLTRRDAEEIFSLREALEGLAIEYAVQQATDEQIDELERIVDDMIALRGSRGFTPFDTTDLDLLFHHTLCRISGHQRVLSAWEALGGQIRVLFVSHRALRLRRLQEPHVEWHRGIVETLRSRDAERGRALLSRQFRAGLRELAGSFASGDADPEGVKD